MIDIKQITKNKGNKESPWNIPRVGSRAAATSKMERFVINVNYYHKALYLGCYSSPRSASDTSLYGYLPYFYV